MAWDFCTDPAFQKTLDWIRAFVDDEIIPLELLQDQLSQAERDALWAPFKKTVQREGLWAPHLGPEYGGQGLGDVKLALIHEILGRCMMAPEVFGCQAPDSGNAELLAVGADESQRRRWLEPLMRGELRSAFVMTEPHVASSDPTALATTCVRDGDAWRIDGHKWFASNASVADFMVVMVVTDPDAEPHRRAAMVIVPRDAPGVNLLRDPGTMSHPYVGEDHLYEHIGGHSELRFDNCRVPLDHMIGGPGDGFVLAQKRLGGGRVHHAMRIIGQANRAFEMMCERAVSRRTRGQRLGDLQMVQDMVAESCADLEAARLMVLKAAWTMDQRGEHGSRSRAEIAMIKFFVPRMLMSLLDRAIQLHGALGYSCDMPLEGMYRVNRALRIADGADEVHKQTLARQVLKTVEPVSGWPSEHVPTCRRSAMQRFGELVASVRQN